MAVLVRTKRIAVAVVCNDNWLWNYFVMLLEEYIDRVVDESMSEYFFSPACIVTQNFSVS